MWKRNIPGELFAQALRNENSGHFEAAIESYKSALTKVKQNRFKNNSLENSITEKLKTLNTVIAYNKSFQYNK